MNIFSNPLKQFSFTIYKKKLFHFNYFIKIPENNFP